MRKEWNVTLMPFDKYRRALVEKTGDDWDRLSTCECIAGGLDIGFDFM
jgi:hypothetical protein